MPKINLHLELVRLENGETVARCDCGKVICAGDANFKDYLLRRDGPLSDAGPYKIFSGAYMGKERFVFRQFYCPQCLTLLETEVAPKDSPTLKDCELSLRRAIKSID